MTDNLALPLLPLQQTHQFIQRHVIWNLSDPAHDREDVSNDLANHDAASAPLRQTPPRLTSRAIAPSQAVHLVELEQALLNTGVNTLGKCVGTIRREQVMQQIMKLLAIATALTTLPNE